MSCEDIITNEQGQALKSLFLFSYLKTQNCMSLEVL